MQSDGRYEDRSDVAPFAGAWIETTDRLPHRPRHVVAPFAGAWIETSPKRIQLEVPDRRPLRGGVD